MQAFSLLNRLTISLAKYAGKNVACMKVGLKCLGPRALTADRLVQQPCPFDIVLDFDTAYIRKNPSQCGRPATLTLDSRCASCSAQYHFSCSTEAAYLGARPDQTHCDQQDCLLEPWASSRFCKSHFWNRTVAGTGSSRTLMDQVEGALGQASTADWKCDQSFQRVMAVHDQIKGGLLPKSRLICLDLEFEVCTRKLLEVGVCEYTSGEPLIDTRVSHDVS